MSDIASLSRFRATPAVHNAAKGRTKPPYGRVALQVTATSGGAATRCKVESSLVATTLPSAPEGQYTPAGGATSMNLVTAAVNALFSFQPFFRFATKQARKMIVQRGEEIGHPWAPRLAELRSHDWDAELAAVEAESLVAAYPEYYLQPFHAYERGNLSWNAALEVELAAKSVHANVYDPERKILDPDGDDMLRRRYHEAMKPMLRRGAPRRILDMGCATGLSTFSLYEAFPDAEEFVGVDLSPHFLAVANYNLRERSQKEGRKLPFKFLHAAAEATGLAEASFDLVSICLVCHELPRTATNKIIEEAHRVLRRGGALAIMEMNPHSPLLQAMVNNVFAFTAFKATEPYFDDYRTFPIEEAIAASGFEAPKQMESSPRHRTIVAHKL